MCTWGWGATGSGSATRAGFRATNRVANATAYFDLWANGRRIQKSTGHRTEAAAKVALARIELEAADPDGARLRGATLTSVIQNLLRNSEEEVLAKELSPDTLQFHQIKAGHLLRVFERDDDGHRRPLSMTVFAARHVDQYVSRGRREGRAITPSTKS